MKKYNYLFLYIVSVMLTISCHNSNEPEETRNNYFSDNYLFYQNWHDSSTPIKFFEETGFNQFRSIGYPFESMAYKSKVYWLNPSEIPLSDIMDTTSQESVKILQLYYGYAISGAYCFNFETPKKEFPTVNWSGTVCLLNETNKKKIKTSFHDIYLNLWINILDDMYPREADLCIYVDLGTISEDIIPNGILDTEDKNNNKELDDGEDLGIDGLADQNEAFYNPHMNTDPYLDNYDKYEGINNPESNNILDSEDINNDNVLETKNDYYTYKIILNKNMNESTKKIGKNNWIQLKIKLDKPDWITGNPNQSASDSFRINFINMSHFYLIRIAEIKFSSE